MHYMGGSAWGVKNEQYYGLKSLDYTQSAIFVAPHGYTDGMPWRVSDNKDHLFFDELLNFLKNYLCIDQSRVFVAGFSFGSMFTNSLAQVFQDKIRAVAVFSTADINIYIPPNSGKQIAWWGSVGMSDSLCTPQLGRSARNRILKNNGPGRTDCTWEKATEYSGGKHVCYSYKCVDPRYPVRWCTFNGGHQWDPREGNQRPWTTDEVWAFFNQF